MTIWIRYLNKVRPRVLNGRMSISIRWWRRWRAQWRKGWKRRGCVFSRRGRSVARCWSWSGRNHCCHSTDTTAATATARMVIGRRCGCLVLLLVVQLLATSGHCRAPMTDRWVRSNVIERSASQQIKNIWSPRCCTRSNASSRRRFHRSTVRRCQVDVEIHVIMN